MTDEGLRNIWRMVDAASGNLPLRRPRQPRHPARHSEGVFATSACIASIVGQCILKEDKGDPTGG
jgi:gamma-glutamyltranspeptidase